MPVQAVDDALDVLVVDESGETGTPIRVLGPPQSSLPAPSERNLLHQPLATVPAAVNAVLGGSERPIPRPAGTHGAASLSDDSRRVLLEAVGTCSNHSLTVLLEAVGTCSAHSLTVFAIFLLVQDVSWPFWPVTKCTDPTIPAAHHRPCGSHRSDGRLCAADSKACWHAWRRLLE
jgi:hypothetical protein